VKNISWPTVAVVLIILVVLGMVAGGRLRKPITG